MKATPPGRKTGHGEYDSSKAEAAGRSGDDVAIGTTWGPVQLWNVQHLESVEGILPHASVLVRVFSPTPHTAVRHRKTSVRTEETKMVCN